LRHLLAGGFRQGVSRDKGIYKITTDDIGKLTNLNDDQTKVADTIYEYFNTIQKDFLNKTSMSVNGYEIANEPVYFPINIYGQDINEPSILRVGSTPDNMRQFMKETLEGMGMLKERKKSNAPLVIDDALSTTYKSIKKASAYAGLAEPLRTAKAVMFDPKFREEVLTRYGKHYMKNLEHHVGVMEGETHDIDKVDKVVTDYINRIDVALLGANIFVSLKQPVSLLAAATEIDKKYLAKEQFKAQRIRLR